MNRYIRTMSPRDSTTAPRLSPEVWARLDPHAGRLSRTSRGLWAAGVAVYLCLLAAGGYGYMSGWWSESIEAGSVTGGGDSDLGRWEMTVVLRDLGFGGQRIVAVGRSGAGLRLESVQGLPVELGRGGRADVTLVYRLEDCSAREAGAWPVPVTVDRPWGTSRIDVALPGGQMTGGDDATEWQAEALDFLCGRDGPHRNVP